MNVIPNILCKAMVAFFAVSLFASAASAVPLSMPGVPTVADAVIAVSGDCHAIGMQQAAQMGGQLARATPDVRGGQQVCVIIVLMPAKDGQRPRRSEIVVPLG